MRGCRGEMIIATPPCLDLAPVPGPVLSRHIRSIPVAFNLHTLPPAVTAVFKCGAPFCRGGD